MAVLDFPENLLFFPLAASSFTHSPQTNKSLTHTHTQSTLVNIPRPLWM